MTYGNRRGSNEGLPGHPPRTPFENRKPGAAGPPSEVARARLPLLPPYRVAPVAPPVTSPQSPWEHGECSVSGLWPVPRSLRTPAVPNRPVTRTHGVRCGKDRSSLALSLRLQALMTVLDERSTAPYGSARLPLERDGAPHNPTSMGVPRGQFLTISHCTTRLSPTPSPFQCALFV